MIKHIVAWQFADSADGRSKTENVALVVQALRALPQVLSGVVEFEVVPPQDGLESTADLLLYSVFDDEAALQAYIDHPQHKEAAALIGKVRSGRACVDYDPAAL